MQLINEIKNLERSEIKEVVEKRLNEFKELGKNWFSELCFCILTANSKAETALKVQKELGYYGFSSMPRKEIAECIKRNKHRFHNNKAKYIVEARKFKNIQEIVLREKEAREWLVENVKGLGYKEASHFLRNVGYENYAILDRHILNLMKENGMINDVKLGKKNYLEIEKKFLELAKKTGMSAAKLDLYMWFMRTGKVLK